MMSFKTIPYLGRNMTIQYLLLCSLLMALTGCQQLFHAQDAPLKGQAVTVSMTLPDKPPPALKPLQQQTGQPLSQEHPAHGSLDNRLLPTQVPASGTPLALKVSPEPDRSRPVQPARVRILKADTVLSGKTIAEDMVLRGTVLINGSLVIAPQATLRIEPGTVLRIAPANGSEELPRIVIQGRIVATGTVQQPILFTSAFSEPDPGDWGGLVLLNSEKKNSLDHCRIEGALTGLEAHYSRFTGRGITVTRSHAGLVLFDSEAGLQGCLIHRCDTGCRLSDSELDMRDSRIGENRLGISALHSSFTLSGVKLDTHSQEGISADKCRFRINNCLFADNRCGIRLTGGDGQIFLSRFYQQRENGAELTDVRIRISNSSFTHTNGVGIVLKNARGSVVGSAFSENKAGNLLNTGNELFAALLNWWGSADEKVIAAGIKDRGRKDATALVPFSPFLKERPATAP